MVNISTWLLSFMIGRYEVILVVEKSAFMDGDRWYLVTILRSTYFRYMVTRKVRRALVWMENKGTCLPCHQQWSGTWLPYNMISYIARDNGYVVMSSSIND